MDHLPFEETEEELRAEARRQEIQYKIEIMEHQYKSDMNRLKSWSDQFDKEKKEREKREAQAQAEWEATLSYQVVGLMGNFTRLLWIIHDNTVTPVVRLLTRAVTRLNDITTPRDL